MDERASSLVVVGASAGGVEALTALAAGLPADLGAPVCVVLHLRPDAESHLAHIVSRAGPLRAVQTRETMDLEPGCIYVAPPGHHLVVDGKTVRAELTPPENGFRPSIDVLFRSAAAEFGEQAIGVILSGTRDDGVEGAIAIGEAGGCVLVQDPATAKFAGLPAAALSQDNPDQTLPLEEIAPRIAAIVGSRASPAMSDNGKGDAR